MRQLSVYLPPLAGDYSGVCSALFDYNCLILIQDAACCTRNYVDYDEPRWSRTKRTTLCAQLRTMDAILGNDEKLVRKALEAAEQTHPDFIAVLGSPVPAIIGTDFEGIAHEVEALSGLPTLGFSTTGFSTCESGVSMALEALCARFALPGVPQLPHGVNALGLTPLDFGAEGNDKLLRAWLERAGFQVNCMLAMGCTLDQTARLAAARVNLVVSRGGLAAARVMQRRFGIPWVAGVPVGDAGGEAAARLLRATLIDGENRVLHPERQSRSGRALLIVAEQLTGNGLRAALAAGGWAGECTVASLFGLDSELALPGDLALGGESELLALLRSGRYEGLIADPLITALPGAEGLWRGQWVHPAVSSHLHARDVPKLFGESTEGWLRHWAVGR